MQFASSQDKHERICAAPGVQAICPSCQHRVIAKCGEIKIWHWAHEAKQDCDPWYEPESAWHAGWKALVSPERTEVVFGGGVHRADIVGNDDVVVELQHSAISSADIRQRQAFYGKMVWLFDGSAFHKNVEWQYCGHPEYGGVVFFYWKWSRRGHALAAEEEAKVYWDFGDKIFRVLGFYRERNGISTGRAGWGRMFLREEFVGRHLARHLIDGGSPMSELLESDGKIVGLEHVKEDSPSPWETMCLRAQSWLRRGVEKRDAERDKNSNHFRDR